MISLLFIQINYTLNFYAIVLLFMFVLFLCLFACFLHRTILHGNVALFFYYLYNEKFKALTKENIVI